MPECIFETEGIWIKLPDKLIVELNDMEFDVGGTLHAFEHAAISTIPLFALCDKGDIGGLSYETYPGFGMSAIFIYDGQEGGVGLSRRAYEVLGDWLKATLAIIEECRCEYGCPSCVQDPQCGSGNQPLDKAGSAWLARKLISKRH
jgi:DEAD/DEAH box helicase domain-containing protein